jgi:methionyl-tRNA formyltransferase
LQGGNALEKEPALGRLVVLTQPEFAAAVTRPLHAAVPGLAVQIAVTRDDLDKALADGVEDARLVSFGSGIIVSAAVLGRLPGPAYNFHPGPPGYPGTFPSVFALYDGMTQFGVTLHEMAPQIDSGPIIAADVFNIRPEWDRLALDTVTFSALLRQLERFAPQLADTPTPLPRSSIGWSGPRRTRKDFNTLCNLPADADAAEFARRYRAVGEGPEHALTVTRDGQTFQLTTGKGGDVVRGGQPVAAA